ncbi:hypothetical protein HCBAA847_2007 [Helicobacter cinaedi CCUG 18818 = ATCC BAA-847]|uniref:Uncharacterized protein n=1 Tax=Helicobacter cinaedi CCUG 18818 = ATCC BAA-847 TaxID=537971 RepID=A0AAI8QHW1_9HELI|nr:hypothetical protein HCBAA847_2007 [Helicobacter cinaedi CCUG 18818 = ATCC BAA-847]
MSQAYGATQSRQNKADFAEVIHLFPFKYVIFLHSILAKFKNLTRLCRKITGFLFVWIIYFGKALVMT